MAVEISLFIRGPRQSQTKWESGKQGRGKRDTREKLAAYHLFNNNFSWLVYFVPNCTASRFLNLNPSERKSLTFCLI